MYDILVVKQNYSGDGTNGALTLRRGDLVEVLSMEQTHSNGSVNGADNTAKKYVFNQRQLKTQNTQLSRVDPKLLKIFCVCRKFAK